MTKPIVLISSTFLAFLLGTLHAQAFLIPNTLQQHSPPQHAQTTTWCASRATATHNFSLQARPKNKWDDLVDEDDDDDDDNYFISDNKSDKILPPPDMTYTEANIRRQADTYDQLVNVGGEDVVNDVYVRAPGGRQWWLVGKVARVSGKCFAVMSAC